MEAPNANVISPTLFKKKYFDLINNLTTMFITEITQISQSIISQKILSALALRNFEELGQII